MRVTSTLKALSHDVIFVATCNAVLILGDKIQIQVSITVCQNIFNITNICHKFTSLKSRIALQVSRKIAQCDKAFSNGC